MSENKPTEHTTVQQVDINIDDKWDEKFIKIVDGLF